MIPITEMDRWAGNDLAGKLSKFVLELGNLAVVQPFLDVENTYVAQQMEDLSPKFYNKSLI